MVMMMMTTGPPIVNVWSYDDDSYQRWSSYPWMPKLQGRMLPVVVVDVAGTSVVIVSTIPAMNPPVTLVVVVVHIVVGRKDPHNHGTNHGDGGNSPDATTNLLLVWWWWG
jgi:hypothetical protein